MRSRIAADRLIAAIVIVFLAGNLGRFAWSGVQAGVDTLRYTDGAARLLDGRPLEAFQAVHAAYLALIALCQSVGLGTAGLVLMQIVIGAVAVFAVYRLGFALSGPTAGLIAAILFACDVDTARWHTFVLTDSLYVSLLAISVWRVHHVTATEFPHWRHTLAGALPLVLLVFMRLEGWLVAPFAALHWALNGMGRRVRRVVGVTLALGCATVWLASMPRVRENVDGILPVESLLSGQTIWGSDQWTVTMPLEPGATADRRGLPSGVRYAMANPAQTSALMLARVAVHFGHVRPFYSLAHNLLILGWLVPVYAFALHGWRTVGSQPLARWSLSIIVVHTGIVAFTHADWDGRFLAYVLPLIYVFSACGIAHMMQTSRFFLFIGKSTPATV